MPELTDYAEMHQGQYMLLASTTRNALLLAEMVSRRDDLTEATINMVDDRIKELYARCKGNRGEVPMTWGDLRLLTSSVLRDALAVIEKEPR